MEPLSILALALYGAYQASQRKKNSGSSLGSSTPYTPPKKTKSASQPEIKKKTDTPMCQPKNMLSDKKKKSDTPMCQPKNKLSDNNKNKAE